MSNPWLHTTLVLNLARLIDNFNGNHHHQFVSSVEAVDRSFTAYLDRSSEFEPQNPVGGRL